MRSLRGKTFVELFDPIRGLMEDIDFSRNPSTSRPLSLSETGDVGEFRALEYEKHEHRDSPGC